MRRVPVLLAYPFAAALDYAVPEGLDPKPGDAVRVPLGRHEVFGVVRDGPAGRAVAEARLRPPH
ncbi:MAG: hypothetical protein ACREFP_06340, partial [Acetobacteraceae bacterium]